MVQYKIWPAKLMAKFGMPVGGGQFGGGGGPQPSPFTARMASPVPPVQHHQQQPQHQQHQQHQQPQQQPRLALSGQQPSAFASVPAPATVGGGLMRGATGVPNRPALATGHNGSLGPGAGLRGYPGEPPRQPGVRPAGPGQGYPPASQPPAAQGYPGSQSGYPSTSDGYSTANHQGYPGSQQASGYPPTDGGQWPGQAGVDSVPAMNGPVLAPSSADVSLVSAGQLGPGQQNVPTYPPVTAPHQLYQQPQQQQPTSMAGGVRPTGGQGSSISGMLADFSRALGLGGQTDKSVPRSTAPVSAAGYMRPQASYGRPPVSMAGPMAAPADPAAALDPAYGYPSGLTAEQVMYHQQMAAHHQAQHQRKQRLLQHQQPNTASAARLYQAVPTASLLPGSTVTASAQMKTTTPIVLVANQTPAVMATQMTSHVEPIVRGHGGLYRQTSLDSADLREPTSLNSLAMARPSTSMTNLAAAAKTPLPELPARPGSALGIMSETSRLASLAEAARENLNASIASVLPPDLQHLVYSRPGVSSSFSETFANQLTYANSLKNELRTASDDKRRLLEAELSALNEERRRTLRQTNLSPATRQRDDEDMLMSYGGVLGSRLKSLEYESLDGGRLDRSGAGGWGDPSQPYIGSYPYGGGLRDTAISAYLGGEDGLERRLAGAGARSLQRRLSDGGLQPSDLSRGYPGGDSSPRHRLSRRARKPRSWHPSPYGSDDEDELIGRDERRHKIKQEISRRRHHIEENSSLHDELLRLARLRESAELSLSDRSEPAGAPGRPSGGHSVLKSIDEIMRDEGYGRRVPDPGLSYYSSPPARRPDLDGRVGRKFSSSDEERSMNRLAATFNANELYYDPMPEYSSYSKQRVDATGALGMDSAARSRHTQRADDPSARKLYKGKYDRRWH
ncbi:hypothetical protein FJT64_020162 [Amphibalanus amphitrite]|uniref:Uncharacterized protein n=1 Tax=Amphibalanus amphitrite TaxID=1232801 RepID=A0A6A4WRG2_AMPAM|nr:hypothetical protein FJT64_020162 [Amphibalanus amphitrite]